MNAVEQLLHKWETAVEDDKRILANRSLMKQKGCETEQRMLTRNRVMEELTKELRRALGK